MFFKMYMLTWPLLQLGLTGQGAWAWVEPACHRRSTARHRPLLSMTESYSKAYPRLRIDLQPRPEARTDQSKSLWGNLQRSWRRQQVERKVDSWVEGLDNLEAMAFLWRSAVDLLDSNTQEKEWAFADASPRLLRQWIDIIDWMQETIQEKRVIAEYREIADIPCLKLRRVAPRKEEVAQAQYDPAIIEKRTQSWVKRVLVDLQICPFTKSNTMAGQGLGDLGIPVGRIAYHKSNAQEDDIIRLMADTWEAIRDMIAAGPGGKTGVSSILLAAPGFDENFTLWASLFAALEAGVMAARAEAEVGIVCFHPHYATPDGSIFPGFGHMHSVPRLEKWVKEDNPSSTLSTRLVAAGGAWQRRTPHATINVLRADQLVAAEGRRDSGMLYSENIRKLVNIGLDKLQQDLDRERSLLR
jgi:hypothetical protein